MSSDIAVSARGVGKDYMLGRSGRTTSVAEILARRIRHPLDPVRSRRERFTALDDVSFDVERGEVVGIIGRNGAGKSTLLKILSRITYPDRGEIDILGRVGSLIEVGTGFHPELTGHENIYLNGAILGMNRRTIDERYEEIVDFAGIPGFLGTPVKRYSSGMRVRLAFAVAAHLDPEVLIVDEVLSVGDVGFQAKCLTKMNEIAAEDGRTVLYVSHRLETVENLCSRAMVIEKGHVVFDGSSEEASSHFLSLLPKPERGQTAGVFDLAAAARFSDSTERVCRHLELRPRGAAPSDVVRMGDELEIHVGVRGLNEIPGAIVGITVATANSARPMFRLSSQMIPLEITAERCRDETIVIRMPPVHLLPGDYHLNVVIRNGDSSTMDHVHHAAEFTVMAVDLLGAGYLPVSADAYFLVPWSWELRPSVADPDHAAVDADA